MDCRCHTGEECIEVDHVPLTACGFSVGGKRLWMGEACRFTGDECVEVDHDSLPAGWFAVGGRRRWIREAGCARFSPCFFLFFNLELHWWHLPHH